MCIHSLTLFLNDRKIFFGCFCTMRIALFKSFSFKILWKNLLLKHFCDSKLSSSFHFKSFELFDLVIEVEHNISFFQHLSRVFLNIKLCGFLFFFGSWNHHGFVWSINFKENSHFFS